MSATWSIEKIRAEFKAGKRCMVVKTLSGRFWDLNSDLLAKMDGDHQVEETRYEVIIRQKPTPPPAVKR